MRVFLIFTSLLGFVFLNSCAAPSGYDGYMTRSYTVRGQHYTPLSVNQALTYDKVGEASWYDESSWFGLKRGNTSLGEKVQAWHVTGAHKTLPLPCVVKVTNLENGKSIKVRLNDRGPFIDNRLIDLTPRGARKLGFHEQGLVQTRVKVLSVGDGKYKRKAKRKKLLFLF